MGNSPLMPSYQPKQHSLTPKPSMATGTFSDRLVLYLARKNGGYKEPEMRLWAIWFSFVFTVVGYMCYGWVSQKGGYWFGIAWGLGCMTAQQVSASSVATAYAMECFEGVRTLLLPPCFSCPSCKCDNDANCIYENR